MPDKVLYRGVHEGIVEAVFIRDGEVILLQEGPEGPKGLRVFIDEKGEKGEAAAIRELALRIVMVGGRTDLARTLGQYLTSDGPKED